MRFWSQNPEKGAALTYAMVAVGILSILVTTLTRQATLHEQRIKLAEQTKIRNSIGLRLKDQLANPLFITSSTGSKMNYPGNNLLSLCLSLKSDGTRAEYAQTPEQAQAGIIPDGACDMKSVDTNKGVEFLINPPEDYYYGTKPCKNSLNQDLGTCNCPDHTGLAENWDISCFLSGSKDSSKYVGYNLNRETGTASSEQFPLLARTYFYAECDDKPESDASKQKSCAFAKSFKFRFELEYIGKKIKTFGTYPTRPEWIKLDASTILGSQCNEGAKIYASNQLGAVSCRCAHPYKPRMSGLNQPLINSKGPLCEEMPANCPPFSVLTGTNPDGSPQCKNVNSVATESQVPQTFSSMGPFDQGIDCSAQNGWIYRVDTECSSSYNLTEMSCPEGCGHDLLPMLIGIAAAVILVFVALLMYALFFFLTGQPWGVVWVVTAFWLIGLSLSGAAIGYAMGFNWDWIFLDQENGMFPKINCVYKGYCAYFK